MCSQNKDKANNICALKGGGACVGRVRIFTRGASLQPTFSLAHSEVGIYKEKKEDLKTMSRS